MSYALICRTPGDLLAQVELGEDLRVGEAVSGPIQLFELEERVFYEIKTQSMVGWPTYRCAIRVGQFVYLSEITNSGEDLLFASVRGTRVPRRGSGDCLVFYKFTYEQLLGNLFS